ncbi:MAG TPA: cysteine synthase A [Polyangiaceae bacterium]|jgi:cysteine synthase A|nr:cysteine synthase A [Polyangiaceae bacterium]
MSSEIPQIAAHPRVYGSILDLVGDTPLIEVSLDAQPARARLWAKLESANPGGSVKDRICLAMIEAAERAGVLGPGGVVIEPTSGNTGIGLALVCASRGYRCILTMPESMSLERRALLKALGAEVVLTPEDQQLAGAIERAKELALELPGAFVPQQFDNPENPRVHFETTAREILHAMGDVRVDAFVAGVGTGGTISGVGGALRAANAEVRIVAVEPDSCATISRGERGPTKIQGLAAGFVPRNYDRSVVSEVRTVKDDLAYQTKRRLAREAGLLVGISSGAVVAVALDVARELGAGKNVVTLLPDTGERYFSLDEYFSQ